MRVDITQPIRLFRPVSSNLIESTTVNVLKSGQISNGPLIKGFEKLFSNAMNLNNIVCASDMTHALAMALYLSGVRENDEVLTLSFSCLASTSAITLLGAKPIWVDIDPETVTMSEEDLEKSITPRCKAVCLYHIAGYPATAENVSKICKINNLTLIEDCNNSIGAKLKGRQIGYHGNFAVFSFYPNRQINALDGGALVCPSSEIASRAARLRRFGIDALTFRDKYGEINAESDIIETGWANPFSNLNAAVGSSEIPSLKDRHIKTQNNVNRIKLQISGFRKIKIIEAIQDATPAYWVMLLLVENRDQLMYEMKAQGVECSKLHYRNDKYTCFKASSRNLPGTDLISDKLLAIPCGWWLKDDDIDKIIRIIETVQSRQ